MSKFRTEGIILNSTNFSDWDRILTVFTIDLGIVKFFFKGGNSPKRKMGANCDGLTRAEFVYKRGRSELLTLLEISSLEHNTHLRKNIELIECACDIGNAIKTSQMPGIAAPALYQLFQHFLNSLPKFNNFQAINASFKLKILRHDGHFSISDKCTICKKLVDNKYIFGGEVFCQEHFPVGALHFSLQDCQLMKKLAFSKFLSEIQNFNLSKTFFNNINQFFQQVIFHT